MYFGKEIDEMKRVRYSALVFDELFQGQVLLSLQKPKQELVSWEITDGNDVVMLD